MELTFTKQVNAHIEEGKKIYKEIEEGTFNKQNGAIRILQLVGAIKANAVNVAATKGLDESKFKAWQKETEALYEKALELIE